MRRASPHAWALDGFQFNMSYHRPLWADALRLAVSLGVAVLKFLTGDETAISRWFSRNRERKGLEEVTDAAIALAAERAEARKAKDFARSDAIRDDLIAKDELAYAAPDYIASYTRTIDAMYAVAGRCRELLEEQGPSAISFYTTGQLFLEEYYTLGLIAHGGIGTNHGIATAIFARQFGLRCILGLTRPTAGSTTTPTTTSPVYARAAGLAVRTRPSASASGWRPARISPWSNR